MMVNFHTSITESILTSLITICYAATTAKDKGRLEPMEMVIGCYLLSLQDPEVSRKDHGYSPTAAYFINKAPTSFVLHMNYLPACNQTLLKQELVNTTQATNGNQNTFWC